MKMNLLNKLYKNLVNRIIFTYFAAQFTGQNN